MKKVVVKRSQWLRGEGVSASCLLRYSDHKRCCLGFMCSADGHSDDVLIERKTPYEFYDGLRHLWMIDAMIVNDSRTVSDAERELAIQRLGLLGDYDFVFED